MESSLARTGSIEFTRFGASADSTAQGAWRGTGSMLIVVFRHMVAALLNPHALIAARCTSRRTALATAIATTRGGIPGGVINPSRTALDAIST